MRVACLFSGGTDSALAALLLAPFCEVTLVTGSFGVVDIPERARPPASALDLPHRTVRLDRAVAERAVDRMHADGYPRNGIQRVHEHALEVVAGLDGDDERTVEGAPDAGPPFDAVADGTRRDDRVPRLDRAAARSLEDRHRVDYLAPLAGVGHGAVETLARSALEAETGPVEELGGADYEAELRTLLANEHGPDAVAAVFPEHVQSRVVGRR